MPATADRVPATGAVTVTIRPSGTVTSPPSERVAAAVSILAATVSIPRRFTASGDSLTVVNSASGRGASTCAGASASPRRRILLDEQPHNQQGKHRNYAERQSHIAPHALSSGRNGRSRGRARCGARNRSASASSCRMRAVDQPAADVEHVEQRNLAGAVGALGLALFGLERRDDVACPRLECLLGLTDAYAGRPHIGDDLCACGGIEAARAFDLARPRAPCRLDCD